VVTRVPDSDYDLVELKFKYWETYHRVSASQFMAA
jgi:hypothetical protein